MNIAHTYIETPDHQYLGARATVEQIEPANEWVAAMYIGDALRGRTPFVKVTDYDGSFEIYRADEIKLGVRR